MMIIAVGHQKNVGKDTFVRYCIDILRPQIHKLRIIRRGFADKLYDICYHLYGWAGFRPRQYYVENPNAKNDLLLPLNKTVRDILIQVGNKFREYDPDVWINSAIRTPDFDILFVSDLRYPNEALHCKSVGAYLIKISRQGLPEPTDEADTALNNWNGWDQTISLSNDSLGDLYACAEQFATEYILPKL